MVGETSASFHIPKTQLLGVHKGQDQNNIGHDKVCSNTPKCQNQWPADKASVSLSCSIHAWAITNIQKFLNCSLHIAYYRLPIRVALWWSVLAIFFLHNVGFISSLTSTKRSRRDYEAETCIWKVYYTISPLFRGFCLLRVFFQNLTPVINEGQL